MGIIYQGNKEDGLLAGYPVRKTFFKNDEVLHYDKLNKQWIAKAVTVALGDDENFITNAEKADLHAPGSDNQDLSGYSLTSHNHSGTYEPAFSKNTGFNKNLGTSAGTVSEGNHTHSYLPLAGGAITGNLGFSSELIPNDVSIDHTGESTIILDASSVEVSVNIGDGGSYVNMILFVICVDVTNGASLVGTIQGGTDYAFTAAGECLILKQTNTTVPGSWWIVGKYTP